MSDLVQLAMGSWSPLELTDIWVFLVIVSGCFWDTPLEVITLSLTCRTLEVGAGYRSGSAAFSGTTGVGCGNTLGVSGGKDYTVRLFSKKIQQLQLPLVVNCIC